MMSYLNPMLNYPKGCNILFERLKEVGIRGLIIPDLPLREVESSVLVSPKRGK